MVNMVHVSMIESVHHRYISPFSSVLAQPLDFGLFIKLEFVKSTSYLLTYDPCVDVKGWRKFHNFIYFKFQPTKETKVGNAM